MKNRTIIFISLTLATVWPRLMNLGYSNYQGDEILALYRPLANQSLWEFLLSQKKGPIQFLVTYVLKIFNPSYDNEFLIRLPFAVAGILSVYFFYKFVKLQFGQNIALYSSFFMATNGLFVAFSRIVQYQSFVILFSVLTLYFLTLSTKTKTWRIYGLYLGMCCWAISILAHYDGIFIAPFVFYLLYQWYMSSHFSLSRRLKAKHLTVSALVVLGIIASFYIPFVFAISETKVNYWSTRISGQADSTLKLFQTYHQIFIIYIYAILCCLSLIKIKENFLAWLWFLFPFVFMEILITQPRTHIYTYIIPLFILMSYGLEVLKKLVKNLVKKQADLLNKFAVTGMFIFFFLLANTVFVDHTKEYPWESKNFLIWELPKTHIEGLFGFPYYRHWEEIGNYLKKAGSGYYLANDTQHIAKFYLPSDYLPLEANNNLARELYIIIIKNSQRPKQKILDQEPSYWESRYTPAKTFFNNGKPVAKIYRLTTTDLENIID